MGVLKLFFGKIESVFATVENQLAPDAASCARNDIIFSNVEVPTVAMWTYSRITLIFGILNIHSSFCQIHADLVCPRYFIIIGQYPQRPSKDFILSNSQSKSSLITQ